MSLKEISLFSGIGGISLAAHWAGIQPIHFCEIDEYCQKVLSKNFPGVPIEKDVRQFDGTQFRNENTILTAGFPCQPHSVAGARRASADERDLRGEVVRVLRETRSKWFLGENVPGLLSSESGRFFGRVVNDLAALGYRVGWTVYGASDIGAVHRRKRVFIIAYSSGEGLERKGKGWSTSDNTVAYSDKLGWDNGRDYRERGHVSGVTLWPFAKDQQKRNGWIAGAISNDTACNTSRVRLPGQSRWRAGEEPENGYTPIQGGDWREWDTKPVIRLADDGVPGRVAKCRLKALGNAVVPQQIYPILKAISDFENGQKA